MAQRICLVRHRTYPVPFRLTEITEVMQENNWKVDVLCMRGKGEPLVSEEADGVRVYRVPSLQRTRGGKIRYALEYLTFFIGAFFMLGYMQLRRQYAVVWFQSLPDFIVFAGLFPKLFGAKLILDLAEPTPELVADKYKLPMTHILPRLAAIGEQLSIKFANGITTYTELMKQAYVKRGASADKIDVMFITPNVEAFLANPPPMPTDGKFRIITHGLIKPRYNLETIIKAVALVRDQIPQIHFTIMGRGEQDYIDELNALIKKLNVTDCVEFTGYVSTEEMGQRLMQADVGIVAILPSDDSNLVLTYKMFEFLALSKPIVSSDTTAIKHYFNEDVMRIFKGGDENALAEALLDLYNNPEERVAIGKKANELYQSTMSPELQKEVFINKVHQVTKNRFVQDGELSSKRKVTN